MLTVDRRDPILWKTVPYTSILAINTRGWLVINVSYRRDKHKRLVEKSFISVATE